MKNISLPLVNVLQPTRSRQLCERHAENRIPIFARRENPGSSPEPRASAFKKILIPITFSGSSAGALRSPVIWHGIPARKSLFHAVQLNIAGEERGIPFCPLGIRE